MKFLDEVFGQLLISLINNQIDTPEVIGCLNDIIHPYTLVGNAYRIGFKNKTGLLMRQPASFDMIGIIG